MIKAQAPTRLSFFGGGTDIKEFYTLHDGICINTAINLYQTFITSEKNKILGNESFYKAFTNQKVIQEFPVTIKSGIGSSASAAVALLALDSRINNQQRTREELAEEAWNIEVNKLGLYGGKQDQYAAAFGGMNIFRFTNKGVIIESIDRDSAEKIMQNTLIFATGIERQDAKLQENLKIMGKQRVKALKNVKNIAEEALGYVKRGDYKTVGEYLNQAWKAKKDTNLVSTDVLDQIYKTALKSGAIGGKLMGSGGGGFFMFITEDKEKLINSLNKMNCKNIDVSIDWNGVITQEI